MFNVFVTFNVMVVYITNWIASIFPMIPQMIILPFIPILALIVQTSVSLNELLKYQADSTDTEQQVSQIFSILHYHTFCVNNFVCYFCITDWKTNENKWTENTRAFILCYNKLSMENTISVDISFFYHLCAFALFTEIE